MFDGQYNVYKIGLKFIRGCLEISWQTLLYMSLFFP